MHVHEVFAEVKEDLSGILAEMLSAELLAPRISTRLGTNHPSFRLVIMLGDVGPWKTTAHLPASHGQAPGGKRKGIGEGTPPG